MHFELSPESFETQRTWVDALVESVTPTRPNKPSVTCTEARPSLTVPEHVLRGSKSFAARSWKSRASLHSLRVPSNTSNKENRSTHASDNIHPSRQSSEHLELPKSSVPVLGQIVGNGQILRPGAFRVRPSPTPSLRRKKVDAIVKAHGSPTHVRVTAGGRIVPSEQSPLCHPRYGYSAIKSNGGLIKFAPNHPMGKAQWTQATQNGFVAQDVDGRLCQIVDGNVMPLTEVDGALQLFMPAPNLNITARGSSSLVGTGSAPAPAPAAIPARFGPTGQGQRITSSSSNAPAPEPSQPAQLNALELEYTKLDHELKNVDKTEVLHGRTMGRAAKDALIGKRRELVLALDNVRKAMKSIRDPSPAVVASPVSPRVAMQKHQANSPTRNRLPVFLQHRHQHADMQMSIAPPQMYAPYYGMPQGPFIPYAYPAAPPSNPIYGQQPWVLPPATMFAALPTFDGSLSQASLPHSDSCNPAAQSEEAAQLPVSTSVVSQTAISETVPQTDGARSYADLHRVASPPISRALPITAPESKTATGLKSSLNPMSPVYRPGVGVLASSQQTQLTSIKDRAPTPLPSPHHLQLSPIHSVNSPIDTPGKKEALVHSSSIASFETADFFPRNTREYSTRRHEYPMLADAEDDSVESVETQRHDSKLDGLPITPDGSVNEALAVGGNVSDHISPGIKGPRAPPGTPVGLPSSTGHASLSLTMNGMDWSRQSHGNGNDDEPVPNRSANNLSPKSKRRDFLFVEEHPETLPSSSPEKDWRHACQDELCVTSSPYGDAIDFSNKSRDWVEGYHAGLSRDTPGFDRIGDFLEGYCEGLRNSKPGKPLEPLTGSPVKMNVRRPIAAPTAAVPSQQPERRAAIVARPSPAPLDTALQPFDKLKQAVFAPGNEQAILTPAADGPHVSENPFNLGTWAKNHIVDPNGQASSSHAVPAVVLDSFQFTARSSSVVQRRNAIAEGEKSVGPKNEALVVPRNAQQSSHIIETPLVVRNAANIPLPTSPTLSAKSMSTHAFSETGMRIGSMTSMDSNLYRQWPGNRLFSPHLEWKSASSVAQHAGLATGFFAHAQFDGT